jgi:hypothetical protein
MMEKDKMYTGLVVLEDNRSKEEEEGKNSPGSSAVDQTDESPRI